MLWISLAFLTALAESLKDVLSKKVVREHDEYVVIFISILVTLLFLIPIMLFFPIPALGERFWLALLVSGVINYIAIILYIKAIKYSELSLVIPMITFTPLFLLVTSPLILGEFPSALGLIGIILIVSGAYILNISQFKEGILVPLKALVKNRGSRYMLIVAFLWSISSNFDKIGVLSSSTMFWLVALDSFVLLLLLPSVFFKAREFRKLLARKKIFFSIGILNAVALISQMIAITLAIVPYVISIKRTSAIMSVFFGHMLFKEKGFKERMLGVVIMVAGVLLIGFSG